MGKKLSEPLKKLLPRHRLMAVLTALGKTRKEIAKECNVGEWSVVHAQRSPLFRKAVDEESANLRNKLLNSAVDLVMADAPGNVRFLQSVRDGILHPPDADPADLDVLKLRLDASKTLYGTQVPKKIESSLDHQLHITVEATERDYLDAVEQECIDITPDDPPDPEAA